MSLHTLAVGVAPQGADPDVAGPGSDLVTSDALLSAVLAGRARAEAVPNLQQSDDPAEPPVVPFPGLMLPFLRLGLSRLRAWTSAYPGGSAVFGPGVETEAIRNLALRLRSICTPTAVLELNVASLEGVLAGATAEDRFRDFAERALAGPARLRVLFDEYPVLGRLMSAEVLRWLQGTSELVGRVHADRHLLAGAFGVAGPCLPLASLSSDLSDPHQGGRAVRRVELSDGTRIVYKPKSLQVDARFQDLLAWLEDRGLPHSHRRLTVVDRGDYGWVEFAAHGPCADRGGVERFYWRLGSLLAVLYLVQGVDFHHENLVAAGEYPVLVDLEPLFHHRPPVSGGSAHARALERLQRSVCSTGLLPALQRSADGRRATDLGGMGGRKGATYARPMPRVQDWARDGMRIARGEVSLTPSGNSPVLAGAEIEPGAFTGAIVDGFRETYDLLATHREALVRQLDSFAGVALRYIARPTMRYSLLHHRALHPDHLHTDEEQSAVFEGLQTGVRRQPELARLVVSEAADLAAGDVPLFTTRAGTRDLWDSRGRRIADFFPEDGLGRARRSALALDTDNRDAQAELIRQAMLTLEGRTVFRRVGEEPSGQPAAPPRSPAWLDAAVTIGERLQRLAVFGEDDVTWTGLRLRVGADSAWDLAPLSSALYDGVGGLALFFGWLARATARADFEDLARRGARRVRAAYRGQDGEEVRGIGPFWGRSGGLYVLSHLADLWDEPALVDDLLDTELDTLRTLIPQDDSLDVLGGAAGCARVMLGLARRDPRCLDLARLCGERLLERALPQARGVGWIGDVATAPLAGFSHGAAGFACTLFDLAEALDDPRYADAADAALEFERTLFVAGEQDWLDCRMSPPVTGQCSAWCNGAAGVALGRLLVLRHRDDAAVRAEIAAAIGRTLASGFEGDHSLCHGSAGNAEVLGFAADVLGREDWRAAALGHLGRVVHAVARREWRCGVPRDLEVPSLMTGLAGIGYAMLRSWSAEVPSVLRLEPSARRAQDVRPGSTMRSGSHTV